MKKRVGLALGVALAALIWLIPFEGLPREGRLCLALTAMTVTFWSFQVAHPGYVSGLFLALLVVLGVDTPSVIFHSWTGATMYLIIGAYLIASAVRQSGLGERIAYHIILQFVRGFKSVIVLIFALTLLLSAIIPHPWPRAFLIMSVMAVLIQMAGVNKNDAVIIGFSVFASAVPLSLVFLTGDSVINPLVLASSASSIGWLDWAFIMGPPALAVGAMTCALILLLFKPKEKLRLDKTAIREKLSQMGSLSQREKRVIFWLVIAAALWVTDSIHGINIGWITLIIPMLMSLPVVGGALGQEDWKEIPVHVLLFITAAIAIGTVGASTGMNEWLALRLLPEAVPQNPYMLALIVAAASIGLHMLMGSVIAVIGIAVPALLAYIAPMGIAPLVSALWVYTAVGCHYILPYQHLNMLVGQGENAGLYSQRETIKMGIPLIAVVFAAVLLETAWWDVIGLI